MGDHGTGFEMTREGDALVLHARGDWLVATAADIDRALRRLDAVDAGERLRLDLGGIERLDTVGAWLVQRTARALTSRGVASSVENVPPAFAPLFDQVAKGEAPAPLAPTRRDLSAIIEAGLLYVGERTIEAGAAARDLMGFFGLIIVTWLRVLRRPGRMRWVALIAQMERTGVGALPIVGLLSFLIGVVLTFQGADQLRRFGAEIFAVNLLGIGILRELGVLLTAVIVAGRSGSAFTAELGAMQVNEEIDALRTLGLDPVEVLVLPRLFGLVLVMPLLTLYADLMALVGGALMSWLELGITLPLFVRQLHGAIGEWTFWVGVLKAPFFAGTIALVGCHAGFRVSRSAESVGRLTTLSVVRSIFLVIVIDAAFSILFARLHI
ncbi:MAG TPA: MlaE family lipid ABC transporter permease subunit [Stellaceae bacterium]|nr:MlaE family lipid ABC transporter permease subunit [Stellaceae bacterium]